MYILCYAAEPLFTAKFAENYDRFPLQVHRISRYRGLSAYKYLRKSQIGRYIYAVKEHKMTTYIPDMG